MFTAAEREAPTASAVIADIIEAAQNLKKNVPMGWGNEKQTIEPMENMRFRYFVRFGRFLPQ